ncbi:MAG: MaoC family dehydratase [Rhodospirillales bacterium]|nr:MaoC family dehydratase [Rhodospirillales bacterium]
MPKFDDFNVGDAIPETTKGPITRTQLALFAGASGDHNPIHLDDEEARKGGLPGVIAHGMLNMAYLGQLLSDFVPQSNIRSFSARFVAMTVPGDTITCRGEVAEKREENGEKRLDLKIVAVNQKDETVLDGAASIALD